MSCGFCPVIVVAAQCSNPSVSFTLPVLCFCTLSQTELYSICLARAKEKWRNSSVPPAEPESEGLLTNGRDGFTLAFTSCSSPPCVILFHAFQTPAHPIGSRVWSRSSWTSREPFPTSASSSRSVRHSDCTDLNHR